MISPEQDPLPSLLTVYSSALKNAFCPQFFPSPGKVLRNILDYEIRNRTKSDLRRDR